MDKDRKQQALKILTIERYSLYMNFFIAKEHIKKFMFSNHIKNVEKQIEKISEL